MNIIGRTFIFLPAMVLCGFGLGGLYLLTIMYCMTGHLPDVEVILSHLLGFEQLVEALGG
ncbi:MAG: hypothetical protein BA864_05010 [Desulfuromonadales bacterium C00003093]|nr:MAG: hypothetical protein BA864_05010 [Desulfuromonadales bacterium C00003093]